MIRFKIQALVFDHLSIALASQGLTLQGVVKQTTLVVDHDQEQRRILTKVSSGVYGRPVNAR